MAQIGDSLRQLWFAIVDLFAVVGEALAPLWPLMIGLGAWVAFWLFAVNWLQLRPVLMSGGWLGLVLIGLLAILVWGVVAPPVAGRHYVAGLAVSNFVGKTVYVTVLVCIMLLCGSVQLAGLFGDPTRFDAREAEADALAHAHAPGADHGHAAEPGHDDAHHH